MRRGACYGAGMDWKPALHPAFRPALGIAAILTLSACAGSPDRYPSLAIRDVERIYGSAQPVEPPAPPAPAQPSAELAQRLAQLQSEAANAHQAFLSALPRTRSLVNAARGSAVASDPWIAAQTGVSSLEANRNRVMLAMADLDKLLLQAEIEGGAREAIARTQEAVNGMVQEEDSVLQQLLGSLRS